MPPIFRAARPLGQSFTASFARQAMRSRYTGGATKRFQSTAGGEAAQAVKQSWVKRMWDSPIGLKTVHFWAPVMKWSIVLAGVSDLTRPAEKLSLTQNLALTATGIIWTRWCLIIKPRNILLATVNFFLGVVGVIQVSRIAIYNQSQKKETLAEQLGEAKEKVVEDVKGAVAS